MPGSTSTAAARSNSAFSSSKIRSVARLMNAGRPARSGRATASGSAMNTAPSSIRRGSGKRAKRGETALENRLRVVVPQPLPDRRRVDAAEIRRHLQISLVQIGEAGRTAVEAGLEAILFAEQEHRSGGAVVGAEAAVLFDAAAEFREHHHRDVVAAAEARDV